MDVIYKIGRRKTAVARVYVSKGKGVMYHKEKKSIKIKNIGWSHFTN